jgi:hypothetical protein
MLGLEGVKHYALTTPQHFLWFKWKRGFRWRLFFYGMRIQDFKSSLLRKSEKSQSRKECLCGFGFFI